MILSIFTLLVNFFCSLYIFTKALAIDLSKKKFFILSLFLVVLSLSVYCIGYLSYSLSNLIWILLYAVSFSIADNENKFKSLPVGIISIGILIGIRIISVMIDSALMVMIGITYDDNLSRIIVVIIEIILTYLLMKIRRIRNGFIYLNEKENLGAGLMLSGFILSIICIDFDYFDDMALTIIIIGVVISMVGLVMWVKRRITMIYKKRLESNALAHFQKQLDEKEKQIEELTRSNEFLSKIVHRDNHLMSALEHTIKQYFDTDDQAQKEQMLRQILTMSEERSQLIRSEQISSKVLPSTGIAVIDGALGDMYVKASARRINFDLIVNEPLNALVGDTISQTELQTLLCDHIKDAIIAVESADGISGRILVTAAVKENVYEISVKDNGIEFDIDTLNHIGIKRVTTHSDGSGIGFMTTFETLGKAKATLLITEYEDRQPFSKSITFLFDGNDRFLIKSYRANQLRESLTRNDITII